MWEKFNNVESLDNLIKKIKESKYKNCKSISVFGNIKTLQNISNGEDRIEKEYLLIFNEVKCLSDNIVYILGV